MLVYIGLENINPPLYNYTTTKSYCKDANLINLINSHDGTPKLNIEKYDGHSQRPVEVEVVDGLGVSCRLIIHNEKLWYTYFKVSELNTMLDKHWISETQIGISKGYPAYPFVIFMQLSLEEYYNFLLNFETVKPDIELLESLNLDGLTLKEYFLNSN